MKSTGHLIIRSEAGYALKCGRGVTDVTDGHRAVNYILALATLGL